MGTRKHPITERIEEAIELLSRNEMEVTPASVMVNAEKTITWADWAPEEAAREALKGRIVRVLREGGYVISDSVTRVRKEFWSTVTDELEEQLRVKTESSDYDRKRIAVDRAVITLLREKEKELGYEVYPGLFHGEIDRIYSMHGLTPPGESTTKGEIA